MSRLIKVLGFLSGGAALAVGAGILSKTLGQDAFVGYGQKSEDPNVGVQMEGVQMRVYKGNKLVSQASVNEIEILRDRQTYLLKGVLGFAGEGVQKLDFKSNDAKYDAVARQLHFGSGVNLKNKDLDLFAPKVVIDEQAKLASASGAVVGKAYGGNLKTAGFTFNQATGELKTGASKWQGKLPGVVQEGSPVQTKSKQAWNIDSGPTSSRGDLMTWKGPFLATDNEIIIRGDNGGEWNRKTDVLTCTGKVYYFSEKANLVADKIVVYRKERRAVLTGNVRMLIKRKDQGDLTQEIPPFRPDVPEDLSGNRPPAPLPGETQQAKDLDAAVRSAENVRDYPAIMVGEKIEFWYAKGARRANIEGNPQVLQDFPRGRWRRVNAKTGSWDGQTEIVKLMSDPGQRDVRLRTSIGDDIKMLWWSASVKEGESKVQEWDGDGAVGRFMSDDEEDSETTPPPNTTGTTGTTGSSGTTGTTGTTGATGAQGKTGS